MDRASGSFVIGLMILLIIVETTALLAPDTSASSPVKNLATPTIQETPQKTLTPTAVPPAPATTSKTITPAVPATNKSSNATMQKAASTIPTGSPVTISKYVQYDKPLPDPDYTNYTQIKAVPIPEKTLAAVDYLEIFHENQTFTGSSHAIAYNLQNPPMIISYTAYPQVLTDLKYTLNRDAGKKTTDGKLVNVTRWDENSWFEITIFDKTRDGKLVAKEGFGRGYDQDLSKEMVIRNPGNYQIKFEGNYMSADIVVKVLRSGNS